MRSFGRKHRGLLLVEDRPSLVLGSGRLLFRYRSELAPFAAALLILVVAIPALLKRR